MHELSLCRSLLRIIEKKMVEFDGIAAQRVKTIWLEMGALCGVDETALRFYFPLAAKNTRAADAELKILIMPAQAKCMSCLGYVTIKSFDSCPLCGNDSLIVESGQELIVKSMEII